MRITPLRASLTAAALASAAISQVLLAAPGSADADPVTGGTTTITVAPTGVFGEEDSDIFVRPTPPASMSVDPVTNVVNYSFPVTGGDASVKTFFGTLKHAGGLLIGDREEHRSVILTNIVFDIEADTVSATVPALTRAGTSTSVVFLDAFGNHDIAAGPPETFTASDLQLDAAGAKYLNAKLHTHDFRAHSHVGSFATSFTNTSD